MKMSVWAYDVWGNEEDGYEVNNRFSIGSQQITKRQWESDKTLKRLAKEYFGLKQGTSLSIDGDDLTLYFEDEKGYPIGEFNIEEN